ncbi:uncharacterized protein LOC121717914 [Alosa sapidissima]|uniref:uncharacterized protein LOC121717914 n=1 Tax=Alosa sapidissima TaxID=34773 RepID=UPI001C088166|nr:uncharacterized protein LOC121717914 [Alosa sapidissima]
MLGLLAVAMVAALVAGPAEGQFLTKCELKAALEDALLEDKGGRKGAFNLQDLVAKLSKAEVNPTLVTVIHPSRPEGATEPADKPEGPEPVIPPLTRPVRQPLQLRQRAVMGSRGCIEIRFRRWVVTICIRAEEARNNPLNPLSPLDTPSLELCQMRCSDLMGIRDDMACMKELKRDQENMMAKRFPQKCSVVRSDYFDECP